MILDNVNRRLQVVLSAAKTTLDMPVVIDFEDYVAGGANPVRGMAINSTNGVTSVDVLTSPDANSKRKITNFAIYNKDTAAKTVQVSIIDGGTAYLIQDVTLAVDDVLGFTDAAGWYVQDVNGNRKTTSTIAGIISTSPSTGVGYGTGAGGTVTQITNRSTGVTLNTICGSIQTDVTSLAAGASAEFTVTNSRVAIGDVVVVSQRSGSSTVAGVAGTTIVEVVTVAAGSFIISVNNNSSTTAETGAIIINFCVIKSVTA